MAEAQQQQQDEDLVLSFFPDPPPFFRHFTSENQERLKKIEQETATDEDDKSNSNHGSKLSAEHILALPTELRYLIPPEPPVDNEEFKVFGEAAKATGSDVFTKNMEFISHAIKEEGVLPEWTYEQLFPTTTSDPNISSTPATLDRQSYLFRFLRSILLSYISLLGIVATDPLSSAKDDQIANILTMVTNIHALINEYRPHQARETLIVKMEEQLERKRKEVEGVKRMRERVREVLHGFEEDIPGKKDEVMVGNALEREDDNNKMGQRDMWQTLDELLA
ncbi:Mediator of RNA polymerase II transcription subunit 7 [Neocucurbitaria cava]|uniref:Mediator of RNA polymerase II transcription subunit 7 n=1 Tax=Neocucurbitaria cava TaxID=798079 RepID=A0A9W9CSJ3_9PLEO|nr:Mediator of RNA polymerase II transcription subunit 7 [Neocucurbitaria cava]